MNVNDRGRKCRGVDLRGCPYKATAVWETTSRKTWKGQNHPVTVFVCDECAKKFIEPAQK